MKKPNARQLLLNHLAFYFEIAKESRVDVEELIAAVEAEARDRALLGVARRRQCPGALALLLKDEVGSHRAATRARRKRANT